MMSTEGGKTSVSSPAPHFMYRTVVTPACQPCKNTFQTENKKLQVEKGFYEFVFEQIFSHQKGDTRDSSC